jgi:hypothetical protein
MNTSKTTATTQLPPLMSVAEFCQHFNLSRSLFYRLPPESRPRIVFIGHKPMIGSVDALLWANSLPEKKQP